MTATTRADFTRHATNRALYEFDGDLDAIRGAYMDELRAGRRSAVDGAVLLFRLATERTAAECERLASFGRES